MSNLIFKNDDLSNYVIPNLNNAVDKMNTAVSMCNNLDIPNFAYTSTLVNLSSSINSTKNKVVNINEWISSSNGRYSSVINGFNNELVNISDIEIKDRNTIVN